jgi:hypothetical protein
VAPAFLICGKDLPQQAPQRAQVAQLVEQRTENPRVGGSNPPLGTNKIKDLGHLFMSGSWSGATTYFPLFSTITKHFRLLHPTWFRHTG